MIEIDLSKQQAVDTDPRAIQQINFTAIQTEQKIQQYFSLLKKQKKQFYNFHKEL